MNITHTALSFLQQTKKAQKITHATSKHANNSEVITTVISSFLSMIFMKITHWRQKMMSLKTLVASAVIISTSLQGSCSCGNPQDDNKRMPDTRDSLRMTRQAMGVHNQQSSANTPIPQHALTTTVLEAFKKKVEPGSDMATKIKQTDEAMRNMRNVFDTIERGRFPLKRTPALAPQRLPTAEEIAQCKAAESETANTRIEHSIPPHLTDPDYRKSISNLAFTMHPGTSDDSKSSDAIARFKDLALQRAGYPENSNADARKQRMREDLLARRKKAADDEKARIDALRERNLALTVASEERSRRRSSATTPNAQSPSAIQQPVSPTLDSGATSPTLVSRTSSPTKAELAESYHLISPQ